MGDDTSSPSTISKKVAVCKKNIGDTKLIFKDVTGAKNNDFTDVNIAKIEAACTKVNYALSKDMPNGDPFISPRKTWGLKHAGANCVAQSIFLASLLGCLQGSGGKPPATYIVSFTSTKKGVGSHAVAAVLVKKSLHPGAGRKWRAPPGSMGTVPAGSHLMILDAVAKNPEANKGIGNYLSGGNHKTTVVKLWGAHC